MKIDTATTFATATKIDLMYKATTQSVNANTITPAIRGIAELYVTAPTVIASRVVVSQTGLIEDNQAYNWEYITDTLKEKCSLDWTTVPSEKATQMEIYFNSNKPKVGTISSGPTGVKEITNALGSIAFYEGGGSIDIRIELDTLVERLCQRYGAAAPDTEENNTDWYSGSLRRGDGTFIPL